MSYMAQKTRETAQTISKLALRCAHKQTRQSMITDCMRLAENTGRKKVAKNRHLGTIAQLCRAISSQLRQASTIGKKLVKQQYVLHMSPQCGELRPTSGWDRFTSLGYPCKFPLVLRLGSVTARHLVVGVSQTLRRWTEDATYIRQGDHHVGHWPTLLVSWIKVRTSYCDLLVLRRLLFLMVCATCLGIFHCTLLPAGHTLHGI